MSKADRQDARIAKQYDPKHTPFLPFGESKVKRTFKEKLNEARKYYASSGNIQPLILLKTSKDPKESPTTRAKAAAGYKEYLKSGGGAFFKKEKKGGGGTGGHGGNPNHDEKGRFASG